MFQISEGTARAFDATIKVLTLAAVIIGGGWTLYTYFQTRQREARTAEIEAKKPFEEKRLEFCFWASNHASVIATSSDTSAVAKATNDFWALFFGEFAIVEDEKVVASMLQFGRCLKNKANCSASLKQLALDLDHDCRDSIAENWNVKLQGNKLRAEQLDEPTVNPAPH
jgi:hypothetical protein